MKHARRNNPASSTILSVLKIAVLACIMTAILVLILALTMRWNWFVTDQIQSVNTVIKALSACAAGWMIALKRLPRGWVFAGLTGVIYMIVAFTVFGILNGSFTLSIKNISDVLMAFACASCTCILVNILLENRAQKQEPPRSKQ
ncbi:MAG: TIGR04086 family membrane protein [Clostridia bacterium]